MFVRPETIDRLTRERPSNKTFFSPRDVCITNYLASTIFLFTVILIPVSGSCRVRTVFTGEPREANYFAINLFLQTRPPPDATRGGIYVWIYLWMLERFIESPRSRYNTWVHRMEIIIFITRPLFYNTQRNLWLVINDYAMTRHRCYRLSYDYWPFFTRFERSSYAQQPFSVGQYLLRELSTNDYGLLCVPRCFIIAVK